MDIKLPETGIRVAELWKINGRKYDSRNWRGF